MFGWFHPKFGHSKRQRGKKRRRWCPADHKGECCSQVSLTVFSGWDLHYHTHQGPRNLSKESALPTDTPPALPSLHSSFICTQINACTLLTDSSHPSQCHSMALIAHRKQRQLNGTACCTKLNINGEKYGTG